MGLSENIKKYRKKSGLDQSQLAKLLDVSIGTISNYERGITYPTSEMIENIGKALNISIDLLINEVELKLKNINSDIDTIIDFLIEETKTDINTNFWWSGINLSDDFAEGNKDILIKNHSLHRLYNKILNMFPQVNKYELFMNKRSVYKDKDELTGFDGENPYEDLVISVFSVGYENPIYFLCIGKTLQLTYADNSVDPPIIRFGDVYKGEFHLIPKYYRTERAKDLIDTIRVQISNDVDVLGDTIKSLKSR